MVLVSSFIGIVVGTDREDSCKKQGYTQEYDKALRIDSSIIVGNKA